MAVKRPTKKQIEDLAIRLYYSVNKKQNSYIVRDPTISWDEHPRRDWWLEMSAICMRALNTFEDDSWVEPEVEESA